MIGQRIGRLVVTEILPDRRVGAVCDCGTVKTYLWHRLKVGKTRSCGCLHRDELVQRLTTHGMSKTPTYTAWFRMRRRCDNKKDKHHWKYYGGRGIKVCPRWESFENFLEDMGERPSAKHSLDRINNDGNYSPENCKWSTRTEQARNKRSNHLLTINGETRCVKEWATIRGVLYQTILTRLDRGWSEEEAIMTPILRRGFHLSSFSKNQPTVGTIGADV